jgi:lysophospholipase L1-like esterase
MPHFHAIKKCANLRYLGADKALNLANVPELVNVLKLLEHTNPNSLGANSRSAYTGAYAGLTPGGTLQRLVKGKTYEFILGRFDGSYIIQDFVEVTTPTVSSLTPLSVAPGDLLNITGTNLLWAKYVFVGGVQAAITGSATTSTNVAVTVPLGVSAAANTPVVVITETGSAVLATLTVTSGGAAPGKLAAPVVNQPTNITSSSFTVSWPAVAGADSYRVRLNNGTPVTLGNVTTYTFTGLPGATQATADVQALDSTGAKQASDYSNVVTATTEGATPGQLTTYAIDNAVVSDNNLNQPDTQGVQRNTFSSFRFTTAATRVIFPLYAPIASGYAGLTLGVVVNGTELSLPIPTGSVNQDVEIPNLPAGTNTIQVIEMANLRPGGTGPIISDNILGVKANAPVTFLPAETATYRIKVFGDSISSGGVASKPNFEGYNLLLRKKYAALGPDVRITNRTASADSIAEQYGFKDAAGRAAFIEELGAGLNTVNGSTLFIPIGTNDKGVKNRSDADFIADYTALIDDFHAAYPAVLVVAMTPLLRTDGVDVSGYRSGIMGLRAARYQWFEVLQGPDMLPAGQGYLNADGLHPTTLGHAVLADNLFPALRFHTGAFVPGSSQGTNAFTEQFDGTTRNASLWNEGYMGYIGTGVTIAQRNNSLEISATFGPGHQNGYTSVNAYDMSGGKAFYGKILSLFRPVDNTTMNLFIGRPGGDFRNTIGMGLVNRTLVFSGENFQILKSVPYSASVHTYWRLIENGGRLLGQTSADNATWITQYTWQTPSVSLSAVNLVVSGGASDDAPAGETNQSIGTAAWDFVQFG